MYIFMFRIVCTLAILIYILISMTTILIGIYDLYKNVHVLKATTTQIFGPIDWIEASEMIPHLKYLGTILFQLKLTNHQSLC